MKRIRCPKCNNRLTFDETRYAEGQTLVFQCPECKKQFGIKVAGKANVSEQTFDTNKPAPAPANQTANLNTLESSIQENASQPALEASLLVIENVFHYEQTLPLRMGDNIIGRYVRGTHINTPIETTDPSVDTTHCIVNVSRNRQGRLVYTLRDAPSGTGTFVGNTILHDNDRLRIEDGTIITIGATTMILQAPEEP